MNKIILVSIMSLSFVLAGSVYAGTKNASVGVDVQTKNQLEVKTQEQTQNQGEESQVQTQNTVKAQIGVSVDEEGEATEENKENAKPQNKGNSEDEESEDDDSNGKSLKSDEEVRSEIAIERRSQVANAVAQMLQVAERNGGIGQEIRVIAQNQNKNQEQIENVLEKVQERSGFVKFFIGPKDKEIEDAQKLLDQNREEIKSLNQIKAQLTYKGDEQILIEQIEALEEANLQIEATLNFTKKGFSLLGWLF